MSRRGALAAGATGVAAGWSACAHVSDGTPDLRTRPAVAAGDDPLRDLGLVPIINAAGTITTLGGSLMAPEIVAAWTAASRQFVDLKALQDRVGERIAALLKVPAAMVTTGAAGGLLVATAGVLTARQPDLIGRLPNIQDLNLEVIKQKAHVECYDRMIGACGVRIVEVASRQDLDAAINERTVMMLAYNLHEPAGEIKHQEWLEVARARGIPTLLDAAADTPPLENLWRFTDMGYDLTVFSGGKAMGGPQDTGLLLGRKDLIEEAKRNSAPNCHIGRGLKVSKEDLVAAYATVKRWCSLDHQKLARVYQDRCDAIATMLRDLPGVRCESILPAVANRVPHLLVHWDEGLLLRDRMKDELRNGDPAIATARVSGTGDQGFLVSVFQLQPGEERIVGARMREILRRALVAGASQAAPTVR